VLFGRDDGPGEQTACREAKRVQQSVRHRHGRDSENDDVSDEAVRVKTREHLSGAVHEHIGCGFHGARFMACEVSGRLDFDDA
jgi:hypothetical protein